ncbi:MULTISPECIES: glycosyltransferase [unclassified Ensifer]|uniref:glycosyltransferase n=1 Tax=unclassified Ensifer TaxID=2633371 RepID=UPI000813CD0C|nr:MULTISPECIES: glycosyltransferase [unclassified Ensifer]OCP10158.1 hypothetical protein BC362_08260 [Ensifer sp. LC14]OCP12179.1 hypothetical protein BC374_15185 [Ensifer sp. LC13]OCP12997.1 hypothetical protein BBX50_14960 [Ensifer sp. LC11]OCP33741.1 hypothetical protein BC364_14275 [Ensifer sp. LC499]
MLIGQPFGAVEAQQFSMYAMKLLRRLYSLHLKMVGAFQYTHWVRKHEKEIIRYEGSADTKVSILIPVYNTDPNFLRDCIKSVLNQSYTNVEVCIANDCSTKKSTLEILDWASDDCRVKIAHREVNGHISAATNSALELATGEWIAMLDHDDLLHRHAISEIVAAIQEHPKAELIYSDEDKITAAGKRFSPFFKPDFSFDLLRSQNYLNHLTVYRASTIRALSGWRTGFEGSQDYDLNLRLVECLGSDQIVHIPKVLYHWRAVAGSVARAGDQKPYALLSAKRALSEHSIRMGLDAIVERVTKTQFFRLSPALPATASVSVILSLRPTAQDISEKVQRFLSSLDGPVIELIVLHEPTAIGSISTLLSHLDHCAALSISCIPVTDNWPAAVNTAANRAKGTILCFVSGTVQSAKKSWIGQLAAMALQSGVGCVGAKLIESDFTVHSAGIVVGVGGSAAFAHANFPADSSGYFSRLNVRHNVSAVSSRCMVTPREAFVQSGAFNEELEMGILNDIDLSLRMRIAGRRHIICPDVVLLNSDDTSPRRFDVAHENDVFPRDYDRLRRAWSKAILRDPYYSVNHNSSVADFRLGCGTSRSPDIVQKSSN